MNCAAITRALEAAKEHGAVDAEVVVMREDSLSIDVAKGEVETFEQSESIGIGIRVFTDDRRMGFAYSTSLDPEDLGIDSTVDAAWHNAQITNLDPHNVLPERCSESYDDWSEQDFASVPIPDKIDFCRDLEQRVLDVDPRIHQVQQASYGEGSSTITIANTRGLHRSFRNASCSCSVTASASQPGSDSEMGWEFDFGRRFEALRLDWVAQRCANRALRALGGTPCPTQAVPIVLDNYVAAQFLKVIGPALMADSVIKGRSLFANQVGSAVASSAVTIIDQNDFEPGLGRAPFDAEGVPAQRTVLIEAGTLQGYLHSAYTAHQMGMTSTANAQRGGGFRSVPEVGPTNCCILPQSGLSPDALLAQAGHGLLVTQAMGVHTANPISGDFSFGAAGLLIENGCLTTPVRGVTIAGNIKDLLVHIVAVGDDLRFYGAYGAPSVLVSELVVSGQ